jgi:hypothetical protein
MNLQENIQRIKQVMGLISEQNDVISKYVSDPRLMLILREIETSLGEKFTDEHFQTEIQYSGNLKQESGGLNPDVINAFKKMKNESGCPDIFIKEGTVSYRSYEDQKNQFLQEASKFSKDKIDNSLKRVAIPGYSQHHTGKSIDYGGNTICLRKNAWPNGDYSKPNKWGFTLPYMSGVKRMEEPWHLFYVGTNNVTSQTPTKNVIQITENDLVKFGEKIALDTSLKSLDLSSIKLDVDKKTFSVNLGKTPVYKLVLRWNKANELNCVSCENTITKNPEYNPEVLKNVKWENNTRIANLIVLYPKTQ